MALGEQAAGAVRVGQVESRRRRARPLQQLALAAGLAGTLVLTACSSGSDDASGATLPTLVTAKSCDNVTGTLDTLQGLLVNQLRPAVQGLPTVGAAAASATTAIALTLDTVDGLTTALTTLARTQNPSFFTAQLPAVGDAILCSGASLSEALALLAVAQNSNLPLVGQLQQTLSSVSQRVADGLVGRTPGADLSVLTNQLVALSGQLADLAATLPPQVDQPFFKALLELNAMTYRSLALILQDVGALDGNKLASDITALLVGAADSLAALPLPAQLGVPSNVLTPVIEQFRNVSVALNNTLSAVLQPTLQAVSAVLGGANLTAPGLAVSSFADLLDGALARDAGSGSSTRVNELAELLNGNTVIDLVSALLQAFRGLLPR